MKDDTQKVLELPMAELHFASRPKLPNDAILSHVRRTYPQAEFLMNEPEAFSVLYPDQVIEFKDGKKMPMMTFVSHAKTEGRPDVPPEFVQQTFDWPGANEALARSSSQIIISEFMGRPLPAQARVAAFNAVLIAMTEVLSPIAITSVHAGKLVNPRRLLSEFRRGSSVGRLLTHVNVRFYNISNNPGDMMMDTMGLSTLGLPDLQCHFRQLDPGRVAAKLYDTAVYIFEKGPVIQSGHTVEGLESGQRWRCQYEMSLLDPKREILDLNPGPPYAAGGRH